jgi:hypothetical protein
LQLIDINNKELTSTNNRIYNENKQKSEDLERVVKQILNLQRYAKFVNSVLTGSYIVEKKEQQYSDNVTNLDKTVEILLDDYDKIKRSNMNIIEDLDDLIPVLKGKFTEMEENILKMMEKKQQVEKETLQADQMHKEEIRVNI